MKLSGARNCYLGKNIIMMHPSFRRYGGGRPFQERGDTPMGNNIGTRLLAHLGIVAGYVDKLGLVAFLDPELPKEKGRHVCSGQAAKAIIGPLEE